MLVFLDATGRGGLGFAFLPSYGFERMGTRSGLQYSQFPGLQPRSSVSCQAQVSHSVSGHRVWVNFRCAVSLTHSVSGGQLQSASGHSARQVWAHGSTYPLSLWLCAAQITLRARQQLLKSSLQSNCPPFLTSARLFTHSNFPTSPETIQFRVQHSQTPLFSRCHLAP